MAHLGGKEQTCKYSNIPQKNCNTAHLFPTQLSHKTVFVEVKNLSFELTGNQKIAWNCFSNTEKTESFTYRRLRATPELTPHKGSNCSICWDYYCKMLAFPFLTERTAVKCIQSLSEESVVPSCQAVRPVYHYLLKSSPGFAIRGKN